MELPSLAPIPPAAVRKNLVPEEWELFMDCWILLIRRYLLMPDKIFSIKVIKDVSISQFLVSYAKGPPVSPKARAANLRKNCFLLLHRILTVVKPTPTSLLEWTFWTDLSLAFTKSKALAKLLCRKWVEEEQHKAMNASMSRYKIALIRALEVSHLNPELEDLLPKTLALLLLCYPYGQFLMVGSDLVDALSAAYEKKPRLRKKLVTILYFSLSSLMEPERSRISTLLDHLYSLNATGSKSDSLIKALVESTPFLQKLRVGVSGPEAGRAKSLIGSLAAYEKTPDGRTKKLIRRKIDKGKGREQGHSNNMNVHKLSLVTQIQDVFPNLGSAFVTKLLDEYQDDPERVTAHLLEDNLPAHLKEADRTEAVSETPHFDPHDLTPDLAPHPTPPLLPTRRNVYDDDDFDRLAVDTSRIRLGKAPETSADALLSAQPASKQKAAILSALAAFDSDDDERDDTYDVEDVGGTVDTTNDENAADLRQDIHEEALFNAYNMTPATFDRDAETRRSKARAGLKTETGMTDEAIEGWGIMAGRDPRRLDRLKRKFEMGSGPQQRALEGTAWKGDSGTEDSDVAGATGGGRGGRGRGRGRGSGRGRGGEVAGPSDDKGTQVARQRKDASKGSRANHNRRDQRARKMARGGFPG